MNPVTVYDRLSQMPGGKGLKIQNGTLPREVGV